MAIRKRKRKSDISYKIITIRVTEELLGRIQAVAGQSGLSANHLINGLIDSGLDIATTKRDTMKLPKFLKMLRVMTETEDVKESIKA
jgi:hypothetical protein